MHLCFYCISYFSFGTEIAGETKPLDRFIGYIVFAVQGHQKIIEVTVLIKIIIESVKFTGRKYIQESLINIRLATSRPLGEWSEPFLAAKRPTASDEVARGRLVSLEKFSFAFRVKNREWRDSHSGFQVSFASP